MMINDPFQFYFFSDRTAIRYHLKNQLTEEGWNRVFCEEEADFGDINLSLNDAISLNFEYKHLLANLLKKHNLNIMPMSYYLNDENYQKTFSKIIYQHYWRNGQYDPDACQIKWILKPSTLNNGDHIHLFNSIDEVKNHYHTQRRLGGDHVLQQYIDSPDLIENKKYTFRIHVILTNYIGVWMSRHGYVNISALEYDHHDAFSNKKMHITNYVLEGELSHITQLPTWEINDFSTTVTKIEEVIKQAILALIKEHPAYLRPDKTKRFEIFGFDVMMDKNKKVWLLEINQGPDAPMYEENKMKPLFWKPFWQEVVSHFVMPIVNGFPLVSSKQFKQILTQKECFSRSRYWVSKLRNF